ncbi:YbaB/EbfC family nucleoid-associated protein [Actinophytocola sp.]|uniref:YbaB/EbfC family nucleoid-associated protein n=1 Tax=Actinophytocola sp. TaxID=1872138 RepID=UPI002ED1423C
MTTGDYTIDSAIARLDALAESVDREARALTGQLAGINQEAAQQKFTAGSPNSSVTATVTGAGKLVGITISGVDRRRPRTEQLSADLTATILAARSKASAAVGERLKKVVPGFFEN